MSGNIGKIRWMNSSGDTELLWSTADATSMKAAQDMVEHAFQEGRGIFAIDGEGVGVRVHRFDPAVPCQIVVTPQLKGG